MTESKETKYLVALPLTDYFWPFDVPTRLWHTLWVRTTPELPTTNNAFLQWALSGREIENLKKVPYWVTLECCADRNVLINKRQRAVEIVRYTDLTGDFCTR